MVYLYVFREKRIAQGIFQGESLGQVLLAYFSFLCCCGLVLLLCILKVLLYNIVDLLIVVVVWVPQAH